MAFVPLLAALPEQPIGRAFLLGLTTGLVYFTGTLYWITGVMVIYGGLNRPVGIAVNAALIAYLSLFPAIFAMAMARIAGAHRPAPDRFGARMGSGSRPELLMCAPLVWVATELGRTHLFTGFPWVLAGYSQVTVLPVAQLASLIGVYGVSALVVFVNAALALAFTQGRTQDFRRYAPLLWAAAVVVAVALWGAFRISGGGLTAGNASLRVALIQGNVDQADKWDERRAGPIFQSYLRMSREAIAQGARFVIWPESAMPSVFGEDIPGTEQVRALARTTGVPLLIGSDQVQRGPEMKYYNSAILVRPDGSTGGMYHKMHLVPFGEYVPLRRVFFFASRLVENVSDFSPGQEAVLLPVDGYQVSTAICYEIVYPDLVRQFVRGGSSLLTTITNDAWFGPTSAPYQHFAQASMRAIENGRYLVRAANTGISGIVDPYGRVLAHSALFEPAVIVGDVRLLQTTTLYTRIGDAFAYACTIAAAALLVMVRSRRIR